nr:MAG TPA: hypothetical protein [Caudoviricetes sp.]
MYNLCYILSTLGILVRENRYPIFTRILTRGCAFDAPRHKDINHETISFNH